MKANFRTSDFARKVADAGPLVQKNRYFESNPSLTDDGAALLARPGMRFLTNVGQGPIRGVFSESGSFNGDMFVASYDTLYRIDNKLNQTVVFNSLASPTTGFVNMAATAPIGTTPEYLFFADGQQLYVYIANGYATGTLTGTIANGDVVNVGGVYYKYTTGSVDAGTPAGTSANPWLIAYIPGSQFAYLVDAMNATGAAGTEYSTVLTSNPQAQAQYQSGGTFVARALAIGLIGNSVVTTTTSSGASWGGATMSGGGSPYVQNVPLPDSLGCFDLAVSQSFVVVIPTQTTGYNGRFFWIEPGETIIRPLNFATAESKPDALLGVRSVGDQFWLPGESTVEVWYFTGNATAPAQRYQGITFDRGTWAGTLAVSHDVAIVCDNTGAVFALLGGRPKRISTPDIEEEIRKNINYQQFIGIT